MWSLQSNISHIATPSQSWVDDYVAWLEHCCNKDENTGDYCKEEAGDVEGGDGGDYRVVKWSKFLVIM